MDIDLLKQYESEDATPHAGNMIEDFRSIGYSLQTAIADIIDNSIAAKARNVWIDFNWEGATTALVITDDGTGMSQAGLVNAMRPGSKNPLADRSTEDLGRFGLGLKTASFSQCRILTVATREVKSPAIYRCWNLDYVGRTGEWKLLNYLDNQTLISRLQSVKSGTAVIWQDMDRIVKKSVKESESDLELFLGRIKQMEMHLQMVFHAFIETGKLSVWINNNRVTAWDPYIKTNKNTRLAGEYQLRDGITVSAYVLPHNSELSRDVFENASWIKGWNAHQGFYIYRNGRMIIDGEWLGMYKQEEHSKLARIMVNVPNTSELDTEWQLDIKKSTVQLPNDIRQELKRIADDARRAAVEIYRQIGKIKRTKSEKEDIPVWLPHKWNGKRCYQINKDHPLIKSFVDDPGSNKTKTNRLFRLIEETLPLAMIIINESENQDNQYAPFEGKSVSDLVALVVELYQTLTGNGYSKEDAIAEILRTEPFNYYPELTEGLNDDKE
jgi:hypothetical protein